MLVLLSASVYSQSYTKENRIVKKYQVLDNTEIEISNKYGDITIENWDKDSVRIEINYKVTSTKEVKLNKTFDAINFDFRANDYYVIANTDFQGSGSFWSDVSDIASNLFSGGTHTSIDYKVLMPSKNPLKLNLKYGNIYIANHDGKLSLNLSNGDLKAHNLMGETNMEIVFGDASIHSLNKSILKHNYGTLDLNNVSELSITSQSAEFFIEEANELVIDSKRDKYHINEVSSMTGSGYFSRINIDYVTSKVDLKTRYGSLKLEKLNSKVSGINLVTTNTTVNLDLEDDNSYFFSITSDEKAEITYSANIGEFDIQTIDKKENIKKAESHYGDKKIAIPININIVSGYLTLKINE